MRTCSPPVRPLQSGRQSGRDGRHRGDADAEPERREFNSCRRCPRHGPAAPSRACRARGGFTVGIVWRKGVFSSAAIHSVSGNICRLRASIPITAFTNGVTRPRPGVIEFPTLAGRPITSSPAGPSIHRADGCQTSTTSDTFGTVISAEETALKRNLRPNHRVVVSAVGRCVVRRMPERRCLQCSLLSAAVGDGKALDTSAINRAISAAAQCGRRTVFIPSGSYLCLLHPPSKPCNALSEPGARRSSRLVCRPRESTIRRNPMSSILTKISATRTGTTA